MTSSLEVTDQESAAVATHPRVTLDDIKAAIAGEYYATADQALPADAPKMEALKTLTVCFLVMQNGFIVIGKNAPSSPENFNARIGRQFAYEDAIRQLWPIMGYALKEKLYAGH